MVTGDQVAQIYNGDPFAVPIWRAPVYRTPFVLVLFVQAARVLWRLAAFVIRHSVAVLVVLAWVLAWREVGSAGLLALVLSISVVLVVWRWRFPASFSRWVGAPARSRWRAWYYRRRWGAVMTIGRLAPSYQGRVLLPVLGKVTATKFTDRVQVRLVSGQSAADFANRSANLAHGFGAALCRVRSAAPGSVVLEFIRRDALAAIIPALPIPFVGPAGTASRQARGRATLDGAGAWHPCADRRVHRGGESLAVVVDHPGHVSGHARRPGPGAGPPTRS